MNATSLIDRRLGELGGVARKHQLTPYLILASPFLMGLAVYFCAGIYSSVMRQASISYFAVTFTSLVSSLKARDS